MLAAEMELRGESFRDVVFLSTSSQQFTAWTARRVYFSITHNGDEFIVSAARNPHWGLRQIAITAESPAQPDTPRTAQDAPQPPQ